MIFTLIIFLYVIGIPAAILALKYTSIKYEVDHEISFCIFWPLSAIRMVFTLIGELYRASEDKFSVWLRR